MELLQYGPAADWSVAKAKVDPRETQSDSLPWAKYRIRSDSGAKTALARALTQSAFGEGDILVLADDRGVWPTCELEQVYAHYGGWDDANRELNDFPAALIHNNEREFATGLIALSLYFCWGCYAVHESGTAIQTSHDEWIRLYSRDPVQFESAISVMEGLRMERL